MLLGSRIVGAVDVLAIGARDAGHERSGMKPSSWWLPLSFRVVVFFAEGMRRGMTLI